MAFVDKSSWLNSFVPVIAAIVGGLLAVLGGLLLHSFSRKAEMRELHRTKIEEIYELSGAVVDWADDHMRQMMISPMGEIDTELLKERSPMDKVIMLVRLYEPSVLRHAEDLEKKVEVFGSREFEFWSETSRGGDEAKAAFSAVSAAFEALKQSRQELLNALQKAIERYI